jgi:hypothetical protein
LVIKGEEFRKVTKTGQGEWEGTGNTLDVGSKAERKE